MACNSGTAPATVSESKANHKVTAPKGAGRRVAGPKAFASPETGLTSE
jgi:hypothetical protein